MYFFCVGTIFSHSDMTYKKAFECGSRCPLGSQKSLSVSMQLKHKQQPCFAALVHLRRRPTENKRLTYRHYCTKPGKSTIRKCFSALTLHFDHKNKHWQSHFDKIIYFLSLFAVPNGCSGVDLPEGGVFECGRSLPLLKDSRASFQI